MSTAIESSESGKKFSINDPATGKEVGQYPLMSAEEVDKAVARARAAFPEWSKSSFAKRKEILLKAAAVLAENAGRFADEIAAENGKTRFDALTADILPTALLMKHVARHAEKFLEPARVSPGIVLPFRKAYYRFEPKGVIGVISPWNYPFSLSAGPVIDALAAGNTVVLKPSSQTTRSGLIVKEIFDKAGLPGGVLEVVTGSGSVTGQALIEHDDLDMLYFTGSTEVGRTVYKQAAERLIPAVMELGGKDVAIVTRNADLGRAANGIAWCCFSNCGQTCISTELIMVDRKVLGEFVDKFKKAAGKMSLGKGAGEIGSMTMASQLKIVEDQLEDAKEKGAKVAFGGERPGGPGLFYPPTLLLETTKEMKVRKDETFGPLKPLIAFDSIDEAIEIANDSEFGLSGSVWTRDLEEGRRIANRIKTGSVNINDSMMTPAIPSLPFGGVKKSGIGRNHGKEGLRSFCDIKSITEYGGKAKRELIWPPLPAGADKLAEKAMLLLFSDKLGQKISALSSSLAIISGMRKNANK